MLKLNDREWKEFKVGELFNYVRGERQISENRLFGSIPYYSASDTNNGLTDMISNPSFIESKDSIICSTFCQAYFVHGGFSASDEITILNNDRINELTGLFISQSIIQNKGKYNFGHKAFSKKLANDTVLLPVNSTGEPDYEYMEQYSKNILKMKLTEYLEFVHEYYSR